MNCKYCNNILSKNENFCNKCGKEVEYDEQIINVQLFSISTTRLIVLSILTLGLYEIYWFYRNWELIKKADNSKISPLGRSIFSVLYCYYFFNTVLKLSKKNDYPYLYSAGLITFIYIILIFIGNFLGNSENLDFTTDLILFIVSSLTSIPLIFVQKAINFNNNKINPESTENKKFAKGEIIISIIGIILFVISALVVFSDYIKNSPYYNQEFDNMDKVSLIKEIVDSVKKDMILPVKIDDFTTLVDIKPQPESIRYYYELSGVDQIVISDDFLKNYLIEDMCKDNDVTYLLDQDIDLEYSYIDIDTNLSYFTYLNKEDCVAD